MKLLYFVLQAAVIVIAYALGWSARRWTIRRAELEQERRDRDYAPRLLDAQQLMMTARRGALRSTLRCGAAIEFIERKKLQGEHARFYLDWLAGPGPSEYSAGAQGEAEFAAALGEECRDLGVVRNG